MKSTDIDLHPSTLRRNIWRGILSASDQEIRDGLDFYPGAHGLCRLLAMSHKTTVQQVAGIYAVCLALGVKIASNKHLRSLASSREIYTRIESAYRDLGRREGLGNRLASIAWFAQRRIQSYQYPIIQPGSPTCCGQPMWSHGVKVRRWYCSQCKKSRVNQRKLVKRPHIDDILVDIPTIIGPSTKLGFAGKSRQRPIIYLSKSNPFANSGGYHLSRFVVQYITGGRLRSDEHVHHKNGVVTDCRRDNLEVWLSEKHGRYHARHQLLYMLRDHVTGRFTKSEVPPFSEQIARSREIYDLSDIPF